MTFFEEAHRHIGTDLKDVRLPGTVLVLLFILHSCCEYWEFGEVKCRRTRGLKTNFQTAASDEFASGEKGPLLKAQQHSTSSRCVVRWDRPDKSKQSVNQRNQLSAKLSSQTKIAHSLQRTQALSPLAKAYTFDAVATHIANSVL